MAIDKTVPLVLACAAILLTACGDQDVTLNSRYHFRPLAGTQWKLKVPISLSPADGVYYGRMCTPEFAAAFAAGTAGPSSSQFPVVGVLPVGTVIRIDRLKTGGADHGGYFVYSSVRSGSAKGAIFTTPRGLFRPNAFIDSSISTPKTWEVDPDKLEKF